MQKHHGLPVDGEENAGDAIVQPDSHFPDIPAQMIDQGHAQGPAELDRLDILADGLPVNGRQILQPLANRLSTGIRNFLFRIGHLFLLYFNRPVERGFVLIDEPENSLFPDFLFELMSVYEEILRDKSGATHTQAKSFAFAAAKVIW